MLPILILVLASARANPPEERGCDRRDAAAVKAYDDAVAADRAGDLSTARRLVGSVLVTQPDCLMALEFAGQLAAADLGDEGAAAIERGMRLYPDAASFPKLAAGRLFTAQQFEQSLAMARRARALAPTDVFAVSLEQTALIRLGRYSEAEAALDRAGGVDGPTLDCLRMQIHADQRHLVEARLFEESCRSSGHTAIRLVALDNLAGLEGWAPLERPGGRSPGDAAALAYEEGRYGDAERLFADHLKEDAADAGAKLGRARSLVHLERRDESIALLRELLEAQAWVTVRGGGRVAGVVSMGGELAFESALARSASLLVQLLAGERRQEEAAATLARAEARFGRVPELIGGRIAVETTTLGAGAWATADPALKSHPDDAGILEPTGLLAFRHPEGLNPANLAILARAKGGAVRFNTLAGLARTERDAECLSFAALAREGLESSSVVPFRSVAYLCAAKTKDLAALESYYDVADPRVNGWSVAMHAALLFGAGRTGEANTLARRALELKGGARPATIVLGHLALKAGDFEEVVRLATADRSDGVATLTLATELAAVKRVDEARRASARLRCAELEHLSGRCDAFLATLKTAQ